MNINFSSLLKIVLEGKSSIRFFFGAIISFGFSIAVILSTVGLMDGFEFTLIESLRKSSSDISIERESGYLDFSKIKKRLVEEKFIESVSSIFLKQSFVISDERSKAVIVHGINIESFKKVTGLNIPAISEDEIVISKELAKFYRIKKNDYITLIFTKSSQRDSVPIYMDYKVKGIVTHGLYEKDLRFVYVQKNALKNLLKTPENLDSKVILKSLPNDFSDIEKQVQALDSLFEGIKVKPFWKEYGDLLEAVKVEKVSITMILQLIVIVSIFNILAFIFFVLEKQSQSFFLLSALGMSKKILMIFWSKVLFLIWIISCFLACLLTFIFNILLENLKVFELPGDIYVLSNLSLKLTLTDGILVFFISALWVILIAFISFYKLKKKSVLAGLRQEFN